MIEWRERAERLADRLVTVGKLRSDEWRQAVCAVPRHELVPTAYEQDCSGEWIALDTSTPVGRESWLDLVYSERTLITLLGESSGPWGSGTTILSSATTPGLVIRMLEELDIRPGHRVLEIGTGSGYTAALLCHRVGDANTFTVDIEPTVVDGARERLAAIGYTPTVATVDGAGGLPDHAPYDRLIATCSVPAVPSKWAGQLADDAMVLVDVQPTISAGNLVLLRRSVDRLEGRFLSRWGGFMAMRHRDSRICGRQPRRDHEAAHSATSLPARPWENPVVWFLAQFAMPRDVSYGFAADRQGGPLTKVILSAPDGSWCEVDDDEGRTRAVAQGGPHRLWQAVQTAHELWDRVDRPGWERFGLTVTATRQTVWLDDPQSAHHWQLPQETSEL